MALKSWLLLQARLKGHLKCLEDIAIFEETDLRRCLRIFGDQTLFNHLFPVEMSGKGFQTEVKIESMKTDLHCPDFHYPDLLSLQNKLILYNHNSYHQFHHPMCKMF